MSIFTDWVFKRSTHSYTPERRNLEEIVMTTYRNRLQLYHDKNLNIDPPLFAVERVLSTYYIKDIFKLKEEKVIKQIAFCFEKYEEDLYNGTLASIREYGM